MKNFKTKNDIKERLLQSLKTGEGIRVRAALMQSGSHHFWLTGDEENYIIHCYGSGQLVRSK